MNGKMEFFQHGPESKYSLRNLRTQANTFWLLAVELPKDVHVPWIEEAEAAESAPEKKAVEKPL